MVDVEPVPGTPVLNYGGPLSPHPGSRWPHRVLGLVGLAVATLAVAFNLAAFTQAVGALTEKSARTLAVMSAAGLGAAALFDLAVALSLYPIAVDLLRGLPSALGCLRRWSSYCLLAAGIFGLCLSAACLTTDSPGRPTVAEALVTSSAATAIGCIYPLVALAMARRRSNL